MFPTIIHQLYMIFYKTHIHFYKFRMKLLNCVVYEYIYFLVKFHFLLSLSYPTLKIKLQTFCLLYLYEILETPHMCNPHYPCTFMLIYTILYQSISIYSKFTPNHFTNYILLKLLEFFIIRNPFEKVI